MKKQRIANYIFMLLVLIGALQQVIGAVRAVKSPVRAGASNHTTYSVPTNEETLTFIPATGKTKGADPGSAETPDIIYGYFLEGSDCRIREGQNGETIVEVLKGNSWETVEFEDEDGNPIEADWEHIIIYAGSHYVPGESGQAPTDAAQIGTCTITMTGGKVYGICGAGATDTEDALTGSVRGTVNVYISGGEIHEISNMGTSAITAGKNETGYLFGDFNLYMTGGKYTGNTIQGIRNRLTTPGQASPTGAPTDTITRSTAIISGADFSFEKALPNEISPYTNSPERYIDLRGRLVQDAKSSHHVASGYVSIPADVRLDLPYLALDPGCTIYNPYDNITVTNCSYDALMSKGADVVGAPIKTTGVHDWEEIVVQPAKCWIEEKGLMWKYCKKCNEIEYDIEIEPTHVYGTIPAHDATCYEEGHIEYTGCLICGKQQDEATNVRLPRLRKHDYVYDEDFNTEHGCVDDLDGSPKTAKRGVCSMCGDIVYEYPAPGSENDPIFEHDFGSWQFVDGSEDEVYPHGLEQRFCNKCNNSEERPVMEHNFEYGETPVTCAEDGYAPHYYCKSVACNACIVYTPYQAKAYLPQAPAIEKLGHMFTQHNADGNIPDVEATCMHPAMYYSTCYRCRTKSDAPEDLFEYGECLDHQYKHIISIKPDVNFPEAGQAKLRCDMCEKEVDFDFNIYTTNSYNPHNPTRIITHSNLDPSANTTVREATCRTGRAPYKLTLSVGNDRIEEAYEAILPAVRDKHAWDKDGHCRYCGVSSEAFIRRVIEFQDEETGYPLQEEIFETYKALDDMMTDENGNQIKAQEKWQDGISKDNGIDPITGQTETGAITVGLFRNLEWEGEMDLTKKTVAFDLHTHVLSVPEGIDQNGAEIEVNSGTLSTPSIKGQASEIEVDRENGASIRIDLSDNEEAYTQYLQNNPQDGIDAQYARNFEVAGVWQPLSVPFAVIPTTELLIGCDIAEVAFGEDRSKVELVVTKVEAGTPLMPNRAYLVRPKTTGKYTFDTVGDEYNQDNQPSQDGSNNYYSNDFICTDRPITNLKSEGIVYMGRNNNMVRSKRDDTTLKAFRWYFNPKMLEMRLSMAAQSRRMAKGPNDEDGYYRGDVVTINVDEHFSIADAAHLVGMLSQGMKKSIEADANGDGIVDEKDVEHVVNILLNKEAETFIPVKEEIIMPQSYEDIEEEDEAPL